MPKSSKHLLHLSEEILSMSIQEFHVNTLAFYSDAGTGSAFCAHDNSIHFCSWNTRLAHEDSVSQAELFAI